MPVNNKKDYVFSDKPNLSEAIFIGTKNFIFIYPIKTTKSAGANKTVDVDFFIAGDKPNIYFRDLLDNKDTTLESLEAELQSRVNDFNEKDVVNCKCWRISEYKYFKVTANFFGSSLLLGNKKIGFSSLIVTPLGKQYKNDIKEFYKNLVNS